MFQLGCRIHNRICFRAVAAATQTAHSAFHTSALRQVVHRANHYAILGVSPSATQKEIKAAFYKGSMKWHPDRNQGANEAHQKFLKISEAYSVLGNEQKRQAYDRSRRTSMGSYTQRTSAPHRYHSTAFSSSGEYSSTRPTPDAKAEGYRRPSGAYTRGSHGGSRAKTNFEEWERQHYRQMKEKADTIRHHARDNAGKSRYSNTQVAIYQFWEFVAAATFVFGVAWAGSSLVRVSGERESVVKGKRQD
ncbi:hypothetical protein LPJ53_001983 [Coemansia erecta]|uniref:J domain-containing protein n=1 Tax=Coemansia erecta TaxID=147472 RepID=A0A9W8CUB5_9FUNG|nr:hypothetical protein LPJ53_001983 [Coemansia erecta]